MGKLSSSKMLQLKKWNEGVVQREGRDLRIVVTRPRSYSDLIVSTIVFVPMLCGFVVIFVVPMFRITSVGDFFVQATLAAAFGLLFFFLFRGFVERQFADQVVTINAGKVTWARKTILWTRKHHMNTENVTDVSTKTGLSGFARLDITAKGQQYTILDQLLDADAVRFAREVKQAVRDQ
jgi:hypothetical protein